MFLHILKFVISFERGEKEPNAGHLKFCFASAAKISTQKLRVIFSNQKNKIFYPPPPKKFLPFVAFYPHKVMCRS